MDVSDPESPNYAEYWRPEKVRAKTTKKIPC
jgi:hypothetical protein